MSLVPYTESLVDTSLEELEKRGRHTHTNNANLRDMTEMMEDPTFRVFYEKYLSQDPGPALLLMAVYAQVEGRIKPALTKYQKAEMVKTLIRDSESRRVIMGLWDPQQLAVQS